jgi:O-antigen ligase
VTGNPVAMVLAGAVVLLVLPLAAVPAVRKVWRLLFRQNEEVRWVQVALALLFASTLVWSATAQNAHTAAAEAGTSNFIRLAFLGLGVVATSIIAARYQFVFVGHLITGVVGIFFLLTVWSFVTASWSVSTAVTIYKSFEFFAVFFLVASALSMLFARRSSRDYESRLLLTKAIFDWYWVLIFALLLSVYLGILIWPASAFASSIGSLSIQLQGVFPQVAPNGVGDFAAVIGTVVAARLLCGPKMASAGWGLTRSSRLLYALVFGFCVVTMILAQSRSPILGFLLAMIVVSIAAHRYRIFLLATIILCALFFSDYGGANEVTYDYLKRGQDEGNIQSLSGRTDYWAAAFEATAKQPLGGYGAYAGGRYVLEQTNNTGVSSLHNTYMELLVGTGVVGLSILVAGLLTLLYWLFKLRSRAALHPVSWSLWVESLGVLTVLLLRSMFSVPFIWSHVLTLGLITAFVTVMRRSKLPSRKRSHADTVVAQPLPAIRR